MSCQIEIAKGIKWAQTTAEIYCRLLKQQWWVISRGYSATHKEKTTLSGVHQKYELLPLNHGLDDYLQPLK